jgi:hypothetical protein
MSTRADVAGKAIAIRIRNWHYRPGNFDRRVVVEAGRLVALGLAMKNEGIGNHRKDANEDDDDDPQQQAVQVVNAPRNGGHRLLQIEFPGGVRGTTEQRKQSGGQQPGKSGPQTICVPILVRATCHFSSLSPPGSTPRGTAAARTPGPFENVPKRVRAEPRSSFSPEAKVNTLLLTWINLPAKKVRRAGESGTVVGAKKEYSLGGIAHAGDQPRRAAEPWVTRAR